MGIGIVVVFLVIALVSSCIYAILYGLSLEKINQIIDVNYKAAQKLKSYKNEISEFIDSFLLLEIVAIAISFHFFINFVYDYWYLHTALFILYNVIYFITYFASRSLLNSFSMKYADEVAYSMLSIISFFHLIMKYPSIILNAITNKIVGNSMEEVSRDELSELVETAHEEGAIEHGEYRILKNIMHFKNVFVTDVMTPRTVIFATEADKTIDEVLNLPEFNMYSRFPIWEGESIDDGVVGYVISKDLLTAKLNGKGSTKLRDYSREIFFIPENLELDDTLEKFLNRRQHIFMVVDEYGGIEGLITMEDVLETMLGVEILDEADKIADLRHLAKQRRDQRIAHLS